LGAAITCFASASGTTYDNDVSIAHLGYLYISWVQIAPDHSLLEQFRNRNLSIGLSCNNSYSLLLSSLKNKN
jgi:hypothetical protein